MSIGSNSLFLWDNKHAINGVTVNTSSWYNSGHICKHELQFVQPVVTIQLDNTRPYFEFKHAFTVHIPKHDRSYMAWGGFLKGGCPKSPGGDPRTAAILRRRYEKKGTRKSDDGDMFG